MHEFDLVFNVPTMTRLLSVFWIHRCFNNIKYQNQTYIMFSFTFLIIIIGLKMIIPEASSIMRALSGARYTGVRLYTLWIKIGTNQRALGEHSHYWTRLRSVEIKRIQYHLTIHLLHVDICKKKKKKMTNYRSNWDRLLPICCHRELPSWICTNCVRGVLNGNGWDPFLCIQVDFYGDLSHHL